MHAKRRLQSYTPMDFIPLSKITRLMQPCDDVKTIQVNQLLEKIRVYFWKGIGYNFLPNKFFLLCSVLLKRLFTCKT